MQIKGVIMVYLSGSRLSIKCLACAYVYAHSRCWVHEILELQYWYATLEPEHVFPF